MVEIIYFCQIQLLTAVFFSSKLTSSPSSSMRQTNSSSWLTTLSLNPTTVKPSNMTLRRILVRCFLTARGLMTRSVEIGWGPDSITSNIDSVITSVLMEWDLLYHLQIILCYISLNTGSPLLNNMLVAFKKWILI